MTVFPGTAPRRHLRLMPLLAFSALCLASGPVRLLAQTGPVPASVVAPVQPAVAQVQATGFLGLSYAPQANGMSVAVVVPGGPASQAGIQVGDVVTALNSQAIDAQHELAPMVAAQSPGTTVTLSIRRNGAAKTVSVVMGLAPHATLGPNTLYSRETDYGPPPFSGTYHGKYRAVYLPGTGVVKPQVGTLSLTITPDGAVTGSIHTDTGELDGTVAGTISSIGEVSLAFTFTAGVSGTIDGLLGLTPGGRLAGTLSQSFGPVPSGTMTWDAGK